MNSEMTFSYFSQTRGIVRVRIYHHEGYSRPEQLASVGDPPHCRASPPPGIFLMTGVSLERDFWVLFGGLKFAWCQAKGI